MIRFYIYLILFYSFININGQNQKWVKGRVLTVVNNVKIPIKNIIVVINETGDKDKTDDNGNFRVKLKESYFAGEKISVSIEKENWTIHYPLNGEFYIPNNLEKELVKIQILPIGSKLFLSNDHLEKLFENLIKNINNKYIINKHPKKIDLPKRIQDWAKIYGFTVDEVKYKVSEWIENVESQKEDGYKLGLAAFVKKEYEKAGKFFNKTAKEKETKLISVNNEINLLNKKQKKLINEIIKNCQNEGNSFFEISKYKLAAKAYENALKYANTSKLWSDLMLKKSSVYTELLLRDNGPFVLKYLRLAIESYDSLLTSSNSKYINKAVLTNAKGSLISLKSLFLGNPLAKKNIMFAINTLNGALKLYQTKKDNFSTCYWSVDMAICMWQSATYSRFDSTFYFYNNSIKYLNESLDLCRNYNIEQPEHSITISYINYELRKLTDTNPFYRVFSTTLAKNKKNSKLSDDFFYDWLHVLEKLQLPMGSDSIITYTNSTSYSSDITALKNARLVLKKRKRPIALSYANNNLALLLLNKSLFVNGTEIDKNLQKASEILSNNSKTITKVEYPQDWALSQNKLGLINILHSINQNNHKSKKHLNTAIKIFNEVLSVYKKKYFPSGFAETMMYLGIAYKELGQLEVLQNSDYYFLHALKSFNSANEIYSSEFRPLNWLEVQYNLSETYYFLGNTDKAKKIIHDTEIKLFQ